MPRKTTSKANAGRPTAYLDPLTAGQLDDLGEALLDFRTAADLQQWLDQH